MDDAATVSAIRTPRPTTEPWPELTLPTWERARDTLHLFTQVVGKVRMALEAPVNHWWNVTLYVSARGLTTSLMHTAADALEIEFDFIDHQLAVKTTAGVRRSVTLEHHTVASFYEETMAMLRELGVDVRIFARPVEIARAIPFAEDTEHGAYDPEAVHRFWLALLAAHRVFSAFRARFVGKASPVHFFWGGFDLAATRFSGRTAPRHPGGVPNCADWVMHEAYSHEVSSCGFWPGAAGEGVFYSYAYPEPDGFAEQSPGPESAYYDATLREFILPYSAVRTADEPDSTLLEFLQSTYVAAATTGNWDRAALESSMESPI